MTPSARTRTTRHALAATAAVALLLPLAACGGSGGGGGKKNSGSSAATTDKGQKITLTVLAASSLTDVFATEGAAYHKAHPNVTLRFSYAGSQDLAAQVQQGAPADVLVTADTDTMGSVKADVGPSTVIAKNRLVIATAPGDPKKIEKLSDLAKKSLKVVLAAPAVPVGKYSRQVLDAQHVKVKPVSEEANVRDVLGKVELGSADAGIVYVTDAASAGNKVTTVTIPDAQNAVASYPAAAIKDSKHEAAAQAFVTWLSSAAGQKILQAAGFQQP
jgi:molybdate transport system substrate-binding protein